MRWVVLALILATEATLVVLLLQALARWVWVWIRWPIWLVLILIATLVVATNLDGWSGSSGDWNFADDLFSWEAIFPTYRLLWFSTLAGIPVLLLGLGIASLLRTKD